MPSNSDEQHRLTSLMQAQEQAIKLFDAIAEQQVIAPGVTDEQASDHIRDLAAEMFGVSHHWHRRVVRSGPNTLLTFLHEPPDRTIEEDDIAFIDLGPVFEDWEADLARTFVLGDDPAKHAVCDALPGLFAKGVEIFRDNQELTGADFYAAVTKMVEAEGWTFGGEICGHLVGDYPHDSISNDFIADYLHPGNTQPMRRDDPLGRPCHWILEIHAVDRERQIGGFYEQLLDVPLLIG